MGSHIKVKGEPLYLNIVEYRIGDSQIDVTEESLLKSCLYACKCALFIIDATSEDGLCSVKEFLEKINKEDYPNLSFIFVLNKVDKEKNIDFNEVKELSAKINQEKENEEEKSVDIPEKAVSLEVSLLNDKNYKELIDIISKHINKKTNFSIDSISEVIKRSPQINDLELIRIMLIGDGQVGKTSFIQRFFKNTFTEFMLSTTGINDFRKLMKINDKIFEIKVWDTAGQEKYKCLPRSYYKNINGLIIFYDVTSKESFKGANNWLSEAKDNDGKGAILYIAGNKVDLPNREVSREDGEKFASECKAKYYETSSKINLNINEILMDLILDCSEFATGAEGNQLSSSRKTKHFC